MIEFLVEIILELTVGLCVWLVITSDYVWGRVLSAGVVLFLVGMFVHFWRKVLKAKEEIKSERV